MSKNKDLSEVYQHLIVLVQRINKLEQQLRNLNEECRIIRVSVNLLLDRADDPRIQNVPLLEREPE